MTNILSISVAVSSVGLVCFVIVERRKFDLLNLEIEVICNYFRKSMLKSSHRSRLNLDAYNAP